MVRKYLGKCIGKWHAMRGWTERRDRHSKGSRMFVITFSHWSDAQQMSMEEWNRDSGMWSKNGTIMWMRCIGLPDMETVEIDQGITCECSG
jgi:hypothetical protein